MAAIHRNREGSRQLRVMHRQCHLRIAMKLRSIVLRNHRLQLERMDRHLRDRIKPTSRQLSSNQQDTRVEIRGDTMDRGCAQRMRRRA